MFSLALPLLLSASDSQLDQFSSAFNRTSIAEHLMCIKLSVCLHNTVSSTLEFSKFVSHILLQDVQHTNYHPAYNHVVITNLPSGHYIIQWSQRINHAIEQLCRHSWGRIIGFMTIVDVSAFYCASLQLLFLSSILSFILCVSVLVSHENTRTIQIKISNFLNIFSCDKATLYERMSVRPSVSWLVRPPVTLSLFGLPGTCIRPCFKYLQRLHG